MSSQTVKKSTLEEPVTDKEEIKKAKPQPVQMVEVPKNIKQMTDTEIEEFAAKIWDDWISENDE